VASFIGDANLIRGSVQGKTPTGELRVRCGDLGEIAATGEASHESASDVTLIVRPERIGVHETEPSAGKPENLIRGTLAELVYFGPHARARVDCLGVGFTAVLNGSTNLRVGDEIWLGFSARDARMVAR
jgi:ABC-type Fe3+/spermidine/putrescine transport system ATPase subunit